MNEQYPDWGYDPASPFGFPVMSRADWRRVFTEVPGRLFNEYGREEMDPVGWLDALARPDEAQIGWEKSQRGTWDSTFYSKHYADREWRDPDGFHFGAYEFS